MGNGSSFPLQTGGGAWVLDVLVPLPRHVEIGACLSYSAPDPLPVGALVRVPLGRRTVTGLVWASREAVSPPYMENPGHVEPAAPPGLASAGAPDRALRPLAEVLEALPPLSRHWCRLLDFAAGYYQRELGELALAVLPPELRQIDGTQLQRRLKRLFKKNAASPAPATDNHAGGRADSLPALSAEQDAVLQVLLDELRACAPDASPQAASPVAPRTTLLHGVTGSGKTEVYLRLAEQVLASGRQALVLVPEINLTPQLEERLQARFPHRRVVALHSGLTPAQRLQNWLAAHLGQADLVLGTRMAVFASLPRLGLIVVDEEHDPSYKQQEGARYSARDLAVYRGRLEGLPVILGSATPSLESWCNADPAGFEGAPARYRLLAMPTRIGAGALPSVRLLDLAALRDRLGKKQMHDSLLPPPLVDALKARLDAGEQSLVLLNRRGYAPVLHCTSCGWKSACSACSAWRVFHKSDRSLRCHHCGFAEAVPRACPQCGDPDIQPMGRGTERIEEQLTGLLPGARIGRIDADTTRASGSLVTQLAAAHAGEVDLLVGTQMLAKGHDFRRVTLVAVLNADSALFSADFRAPERLFALLMQAGGRAGRDATRAAHSEVWLPTWYPTHPIYAAIQAHDYAAFATSQIGERQGAGLPPFSHLALLRAEARDADQALAFLDAASALANEVAQGLGTDVLIYPPVPAALHRVAHVERAQMLIESPRRAWLQQFLRHWCRQLGACNTGQQRVLRWAVDVDPASI
ncbi:MAG: hypothetical protein RL375_827 [Pseudomonadota bacterium]